LTAIQALEIFSLQKTILPIAMFDDLHTTKNIRLLGYLARPIRDPKGLNGEMKRIIMLMHLSRDTDCNVDMIYSKVSKEFTQTYTRKYHL
jgi:hypothetical protein